MKIQHQLTSAIACAALAFSLPMTGQAQDVLTVPGQILIKPDQGEFFDAPVSLNQTPAPGRASSWQGQELALGGQDVVSYFQGDSPIKGSGDYSADWDNTTWHFASAENRDEFMANPDKYAPQLGGYCAVALANGRRKIGNTKHYTIHEEKLYLNYDESSQSYFRDATGPYVGRAILNF